LRVPELRVSPSRDVGGVRGAMAREKAKGCVICPLCGGLSATQDMSGLDQAFIEGFYLGVIIERVAQRNALTVATMLCAEHLRVLRDLADKIPLEIVGPNHRHLLSMGLHAVKP
jgi:hypothetical protein